MVSLNISTLQILGYVFILGVFWRRKLNVTEFNFLTRTLIDEFLEIERIFEGSSDFFGE